MKGFLTAVWLELKGGRPWWLALVGLWAVLARILWWRLVQEGPHRLEGVEVILFHAVLLGLWGGIGLGVLALALGLRGGAGAWLLLSPLPGWVQQLARLAAVGLVWLVYLLGLLGAGGWSLARLGVEAAWALAGRGLVYGLVLGLAGLALALLLGGWVQAYALARRRWLAALVGILGGLGLLFRGAEVSARTLYALTPAWPLPPGLADLPGLPTEPLVYALGLTGLGVWLAGRIWEEVEA